MRVLLERLLFLYLIVFPFGQIFRIEVLSPITLHLVDITVGSFVFFWLILLFQKKRFPNPPLRWEFLSFLAVVFFSLLIGATRVSWQETFIGSLYLFRFVIYTLFYFGVWDLVRQNRKTAIKLFNSLIVVGIFIAGFGIFQYFVFPDLRPLFLYGWDDHYFRLVGTFLDPGFIGIILVFSIALIFSSWGKAGEKTISLILGIGALLLTYSRASYLSFLAMVAAFYIVRRNTRFVLVILFLFILGVAVLPKPGGEGVRFERTSTIFARLENYQKAWEIGRANPLFGVGFNLYAFESQNLNVCGSTDKDKPCHSASGVDSSLLFVLATTGIVGFIAYLALYVKMLLLGWKKRRTIFGSVLFASTVALLVHSNFANSMFYPWILGWQAILLGIQED